MSITKLPKFGKAVGTWIRNKASKKAFKDVSVSGLQHPVITSFKPSVGKTKHQKDVSKIKKEGRTSVGKIKKDHIKTMGSLEKAHSTLRQNIQKMKGEPVTKSGISKGKDLKTKTKTKHYYPPKDF
jgi:hypothetical protein